MLIFQVDEMCVIAPSIEIAGQFADAMWGESPTRTITAAMMLGPDYTYLYAKKVNDLLVVAAHQNGLGKRIFIMQYRDVDDETDTGIISINSLDDAYEILERFVPNAAFEHVYHGPSEQMSAPTTVGKWTMDIVNSDMISFELEGDLLQYAVSQ